MMAPSVLLALLLVALATAKKEESASGMLERLEQRRSLILSGNRFDTTRSESTSSSDSLHIFASELTGSAKKAEHIRARIQTNAQEAQQRLAARVNAELAKNHLINVPGVVNKVVVASSHKSYQAKFTRFTGLNQTNACAEQTVTVNTTVRVTTCVSLEIGPMLIIGKTSAASVNTDVFDGDLDGKLDVNEAFVQLERINGSASLTSGSGTTKINRLSDYLFSIRNRAAVNGGSIKLASLVLTGRVGNGPNPLPFAEVAPVFQTFGNGKVLISPCFPMVLDLDFNLEIYGVIKGFFGLATVPVVKGTDFFVSPTNPLLGFSGASKSYDVNTTRAIATTVGGSTLVGASFAAANTKIGQVVIEPCAQFSYFN